MKQHVHGGDAVWKVWVVFLAVGNHWLCREGDRGDAIWVLICVCDSVEHTLNAFLRSVLVGACRFAHVGWLRNTTGFCIHCWELAVFQDRMPFVDTSTSLAKGGAARRGDLSGFDLWGFLAEPEGGFMLELDSTIFNREVRQEGAAKGFYPRRSARKNHHPLLTVLTVLTVSAEGSFVLHAWLCSGNTAAGRGFIAFLAEA